MDAATLYLYLIKLRKKIYFYSHFSFKIDTLRIDLKMFYIIHTDSIAECLLIIQIKSVNNKNGVNGYIQKTVFEQFSIFLHLLKKKKSN